MVSLGAQEKKFQWKERYKKMHSFLFLSFDNKASNNCIRCH